VRGRLVKNTAGDLKLNVASEKRMKGQVFSNARVRLRPNREVWKKRKRETGGPQNRFTAAEADYDAENRSRESFLIFVPYENRVGRRVCSCATGNAGGPDVSGVSPLSSSPSRRQMTKTSRFGLRIANFANFRFICTPNVPSKTENHVFTICATATYAIN